MILRDLTVGLFGLTAAILLPVVLQLSNTWYSYLPMEAAILMTGLMARPPVALAVGLNAPIILSMITGRPPLMPPVGVVMAMGGFALGATASLVRHYMNPRLLIASAIAIAVQRWSEAVASAMLAERLGLPDRLAALSTLIRDPFEAVLLLLVVPGLVYLAQRMTP